jgi:hypothetical protein
MSKASIRQLHTYVGLFSAPSVLFFALTGALQLFSLHESHGAYRPPAIIEKLSSVHKDQVFALGDHYPPGVPDGAQAQPRGAGGPPDHAGHDGDEPGPAPLVLKVFFLVTALCLTLSATLGLWMGVTQTRQKRTAWLLLFAGTLIPAALLLL